MNGVRAAQSGWGRFGQAEVAHFPFMDKLGHGTDRFLDGRFGINAVLIIKIDDINAEPLEAGFATGADVLGLAAHAAHVRVGAVAHDAVLGGQKDFLAAVANGLADEDFIVAVTINVGGIQEVHAEFDGAMNGGNGFDVIPGAIKFGHAHAAKPHGRNERSGVTKFAELHQKTSIGAYFKIDEQRSRQDTQAAQKGRKSVVQNELRNLSSGLTQEKRDSSHKLRAMQNRPSLRRLRSE